MGVYDRTEEGGYIWLKLLVGGDESVRWKDDEKHCISAKTDDGAKPTKQEKFAVMPNHVLVDLIEKKWKFKKPKLIICLLGAVKKDVANKKLLKIKEFLKKLIKTAAESESWIVIEYKSDNDTLMELLVSALKQVKVKELKELPVIALCSREPNLERKNILDSFEPRLDYYIVQSSSKPIFVFEESPILKCYLFFDEKKSEPVIHYKGSCGLYDEKAEDGEWLRSYKFLEISNTLEDMPVEEKILKSLREAFEPKVKKSDKSEEPKIEITKSDRKESETDRDKPKLKATYLSQHVTFYSPVLAVDITEEKKSEKIENKDKKQETEIIQSRENKDEKQETEMNDSGENKDEKQETEMNDSEENKDEKQEAEKLQSGENKDEKQETEMNDSGENKDEKQEAEKLQSGENKDEKLDAVETKIEENNDDKQGAEKNGPENKNDRKSGAAINKDSKIEAGRNKADIRTSLLIQCVRFNQLVSAVDLFDLWRLAKDSKESLAEVAKESLRLKRYEFLRYMLENGLDACCLGEAEIDEKEDKPSKCKQLCQLKETFFNKPRAKTNETSKKKTKKRKKIDRLIKTFCKHFSAGNNENNTANDSGKLRDKRLAGLFKEKLLAKDYELTMLLLRHIKYPTGAALYAYGMLKAMRQAATSDEEKEVINEQMKKFQAEAIHTINTTYEDHADDAIQLLSQALTNWGGTTCILLALRTGNKAFLASPPCKEFEKRMWRSGSYVEEDIWICHQCVYRKPKRLCLMCDTELTDDDKRQAKIICLKCSHEMTKNTVNQKKDKRICPKCETELEEKNLNRLKAFLSPAVRVILKFTSHIVFLLLYAMLLVSVLETEFHYLEWVIWSWIVTGFAEQINQHIRNPLNRLYETHQLRVFDWIESFSLVLFAITWLCPRLIAYFYPEDTEWMTWARVLFSIDYIGFSVGILEVCYCHKFLGPILLMIMRMTKTLIQFIIIVLVFCLAYAVASESVLYPTSQLNPLLAFNVLRKAFWAMFGEFNLDEINGDSCTNDAGVYRTYEQTRCPTTAGKYYAPPLMGVYYIIVNILLFNLLIAMFNSKIDMVRMKAKEVWHHQKMQLTLKYCKVIFLPPPFTILSPLLWTCKADKQGAPFTQDIGDYEDLRLQRLQTVAQNSDKKADIPVQCNGKIFCIHKESEKDEVVIIIEESTRKTEETAAVAKSSDAPESPKENSPPVPKQKETKAPIPKQKEPQDETSRPLRRSEERRLPSPERRYYAIRDRSRYGMRWKIVGLESTAPVERDSPRHHGTRRPVPDPET